MCTEFEENAGLAAFSKADAFSADKAARCPRVHPGYTKEHAGMRAGL